MLKIRDLYVSIEGKEILRGINLQINRGEIHAFMGPNGAGKSTMGKVLSGHPSCEILSGSIEFEGEDIIKLPPEERAKKGIFMSFQYPIEVSGITNFQFLHAAYSASQGEISEDDFEKILSQKMEQLLIRSEFKNRHLNEGFSGGEKKRNELLQMILLKPKLAILDEIDSGLDIDALKGVAEGVKRAFDSDRAVLLITHYQRFLDYIKPHFVHVLIEGSIVKTGDHHLALKLEEEGYDAY